jgi:alkanesulfonate monooxygenase SsuD/methylene tetrahydromethanopterin reductase-like flavin-dependent oxidoreductase (luciferase family)
MRFSFSYPLVAHPQNPVFLTGPGMARLCRAAESAGFDAVGFTDHPAPTDRWLNAGGHDALDPFVAFAYCAAATERLLLIPNILVLPYRNPFLVAKAVATLDSLSGGRFVLAVATGYLRGEYKALGVDFDERNDLFDEAIEVIRGVWSTDNFTFVGRHRSLIDVAFSTGVGGDPATEDFAAEARLEALAELSAAGVTWSGISVPDDSIEHAIETLERFGTTVIAPHRDG